MAGFGQKFATAEIRQPFIVSFGRTAGLRHLWPLVRRTASVEVSSKLPFAAGCTKVCQADKAAVYLFTQVVKVGFCQP
ncbi:MAG TPA: hypothetical protein DIT67_10900 [Octadecabacter sp.]|nr:hypothetical protein [Octadecabacter sp.]